ncbi:MAG: DHA2 family efflux MFS transporter permease subunit [Candidatus Palauibacterales bacterium]|nr:DHA2 family efflux MFS transporter permease subunit [Candidatus Palauibacterales bacterium]MDP2528309.1 DHA2 family efflux MFS transporter permease subunit [Candidatus Palauibacterales bacterium]MDP2584066.1 DHA2 family efflux MFS transporter permease subunit [Candidatus Palauibacterales bacterium]
MAGPSHGGAGSPALEEWAPTHGKWIVTLSVMTGTIMSVLDISIVNVALPHMQGNLGASVEQITWVATGYILTEGFMMPLVSLLSAKIGRKRYYMLSVMLFVLASALCGTSSSLTELVAFRILQGVGGGALIPLSQAILLENFPPEERGTAMGIFGIGVVLAPALGPTVGGWITDHYSWPWIFFINVPIGLLNLFLVDYFVEDPPYARQREVSIDWTGMGFLAVGLSCLQIMLEEGRDQQWFQSDLIRWLALLAFMGLAAFIWWELRSDEPAVNLRLFKNVPFASATIIGGILGVGLYASVFILPLFLQELLGYPAFNSGLTLMPRSLAMGIVFPIAGRFYNRFGPRVYIGSGLAISTYAFWELGQLNVNVGFWDMCWPQVLQGVGFALIFVALSTAAVAELRKDQMSDATGLYNVVRRVFGSAGVALAATELDNGGIRYRAIMARHLSSARGPVSSFVQNAEHAFQQLGGGTKLAYQKSYRMLDGIMTQQASMLSFNHVFFLMAVVFAVAIPLIFFLHSGPRDGSDVMME